MDTYKISEPLVKVSEVFADDVETLGQRMQTLDRLCGLSGRELGGWGVFLIVVISNCSFKGYANARM